MNAVDPRCKIPVTMKNIKAILLMEMSMSVSIFIWGYCSIFLLWENVNAVDFAL